MHKEGLIYDITHPDFDPAAFMSTTFENPFLALDVYKMGHMVQYAPGTTKVYSYLTTRSDKTFNKAVFFGAGYYLQKFFSKKLEPWMAEEFILHVTVILGSCSEEVAAKARALAKLGYIPLEMKAVPEGTVIGVHNVLLTMTNTHHEFPWAVGFWESLIIKLWYPITVASCSYKYRLLVNKFFDLTVDPDFYFLKDWTVHDFGYRGDTTEEGAALSGVAHLLSFLGSDTVPALNCARAYYHANIKRDIIMGSVPASEHSVMTSFISTSKREIEESYQMKITYDDNNNIISEEEIPSLTSQK